MKLRLSDKDKKRFGVDDLPFDINTITNREALLLRGQGYPTPRLFVEALGKTGPDTDYLAWTALVWLCLRRAGAEVDVETLEFDSTSMRIVPDEEPPVVVSEGKAPGPEPSTTLTRSKRTSGATSRPRSTKASRSS